jgi:hypothetical protein
MKSLLVLGGLVCALLAVPALAKERTWQTGKVVEISSERFGVGNAGKFAAVLGQQHATHDKGVEYTIQSGEFNYVAVEMSMAHHRLKDQRVELNDTVRFTLEGETKLILMGNDGEERTLQLLKRTQRANHEEQVK